MALSWVDKTTQFDRLPVRAAEVRFIRAYMYHILLEHFGGVSIVEEAFDQPVASFERNSEEEVYAFIIDELNEMFGLELPENDEFDTLGGFIIHQLGHIPDVAEVVHWEQYRLTVLKANRRRIERVRLEILEEPHNRSA